MAFSSINRVGSNSKDVGSIVSFVWSARRYPTFKYGTESLNRSKTSSPLSIGWFHFPPIEIEPPISPPTSVSALPIIRSRVAAGNLLKVALRSRLLSLWGKIRPSIELVLRSLLTVLNDTA